MAASSEVQQAGARPVGVQHWLEPDMHGWAFNHFEEVVATVLVEPGPQVEPLGQLAPPPGATLGDRVISVPGMQELTVSEFLERTATDTLLVVRGGDVVFEHYAGYAAPGRLHVLMSVSKSIGAMAVGCLVAAGTLARDAVAASYVPELASSAFGTATVSQLLDMTAALQFSQEYEDPRSQVHQQDRAAGWRPRRPGDPPDSRAFLATLQPAGPHGETFQYCSATTDVLSWVAERAAGVPYATLVSQLVWRRIGAERPAVISVDREGQPYACAGMAATARDLARFGLCVLRSGMALGAQALPGDFVADTRRGGSREAIAGHDFAELHPNGTYRNQWWLPGNERASMLGVGIFGQYLWVDPALDVVIVKLSSQAAPLADRALHDGALAAISSLVATDGDR